MRHPVLLTPLSLVALLAVLAAPFACSNGDLGGGDKDGVAGGNFTFVVSVDDSAFAPAILKVQNDAHVKLTLQNTGTKSHGLAIALLPSGATTTTGGFASPAAIAPIAAGSAATIEFTTPHAEGIYDITSNASGDVAKGQLIVQ